MRLRVSFAELYRVIIYPGESERSYGERAVFAAWRRGRLERASSGISTWRRAPRAPRNIFYAVFSGAHSLESRTHHIFRESIRARIARRSLISSPKGRLAVRTITLLSEEQWRDIQPVCEIPSKVARDQWHLKSTSRRGVTQFFNEGNLLMVGEIYVGKPRSVALYFPIDERSRWKESEESDAGGRHLGAGIFRHHLAETAMRGPAKRVSFRLRSTCLAKFDGKRVGSDPIASEETTTTHRSHWFFARISPRSTSRRQPCWTETSPPRVSRRRRCPSGDERLVFDEYIPGSASPTTNLSPPVNSASNKTRPSRH